jgi:hypothetical protein
LWHIRASFICEYKDSLRLCVLRSCCFTGVDQEVILCLDRQLYGTRGRCGRSRPTKADTARDNALHSFGANITIKKFHRLEQREFGYNVTGINKLKYPLFSDGKRPSKATRLTCTSTPVSVGEQEPVLFLHPVVLIWWNGASPRIGLVLVLQK